jgi:hypothetical protein
MKPTLRKNLEDLVQRWRDRMPPFRIDQGTVWVAADELEALLKSHSCANRCGVNGPGANWGCDAPKGHSGRHYHDFDDLIEWGAND